MMISVYEILGAIFGIAFVFVFLQGIAEKTEELLYLNYFIGGGGILCSGRPLVQVAFVLFLAVQTYFVVKDDNYWKKGVAVYTGGEDAFVRPTCAYEIKVRRGERYIIVQLNNGKTYYYEGVDEFLCFWKVSDEFFEAVEMLDLVKNID